MTTQPIGPSDDISVELGVAIQSLMFRKRVTQGQIGQALGIGQSTISAKLRGRVGITVPELMTIARVLDVDPGDLLPRLDSNQQPSVYPSPQVSALVVSLDDYRTTGRVQPFPRPEPVEEEAS